MTIYYPLVACNAIVISTAMVLLTFGQSLLIYKVPTISAYVYVLTCPLFYMFLKAKISFELTPTTFPSFSWRFIITIFKNFTMQHSQNLPDSLYIYSNPHTCVVYTHLTHLNNYNKNEHYLQKLWHYHIEIIIVVLQKEWFKPCVSFTTLYGRSIEYDRIGISMLYT